MAPPGFGLRPGRALAVVCGIALVIAGACCSLAWAQSDAAKPEAAKAEPQPPAPASQVSSNPAQEISSHDEVTTFKVKVNLVLVRVVVRDANGNAIGSLRQEDFELFDNRKPQMI